MSNNSFHPITKNCVFITSAGRSSNRFLSRLMENSVEDCFSVHEPDLLALVQVDEWLEKIRCFGLFNMTLGKFTYTGSTRGITLAREHGKIDDPAAMRHFYALRQKYISGIKPRIYAESNLQLAGLIDLIPKMFPNSTTVYIMRDARSWVRSLMNWKLDMYGKKDVFSYFPSGRAIADQFPGDPFYGKWNQLTRFQKICWQWQHRNLQALTLLKKNPTALLVKYEDLFDPATGHDTIRKLMKHLTCFPDGFQANFKYDPDFAKKRFYASESNNLSTWDDWPLELVKQFDEVCGKFHLEQGYGQEPLWQEMLMKAKHSNQSR